MDMQTRKANMESGLSQIQEKLATARRQVLELESLEQRQIGAIQLAEAILSEIEDSDGSKSDPQPQHKKEKL